MVTGEQGTSGKMNSLNTSQWPVSIVVSSNQRDVRKQEKIVLFINAKFQMTN